MKRKSIVFGLLLLAGIVVNGVTGCGASQSANDETAVIVDGDSEGSPVDQNADNQNDDMEVDDTGSDNKDTDDSDIDDSDTDDTDIDDSNSNDPDEVYSAEPLVDIGENYYTPVAVEDVVVDKETGLCYAKNQLLISCYIGTEKEVMEPIFEEVGAKIIGYIELTSDYQILFDEDKTLEDLDEIAEYIYGYPYVSNITLNLITEVSVD